MIVKEDIKTKIFDEFNLWEEKQYAGKTREERAELDQFYTEPAATIKALEDLPRLGNNFLDYTCGCGGLIAAWIIAGGNPKEAYGIELDPKILEVCRDRLEVLGVPRKNIRWGNALNLDCYEFDHEGEYHFDPNEGKNGKVWYTKDGKAVKPKKAFRFGV